MKVLEKSKMAAKMAEMLSRTVTIATVHKNWIAHEFHGFRWHLGE